MAGTCELHELQENSDEWILFRFRSAGCPRRRSSTARWTSSRRSFVSCLATTRSSLGIATCMSTPTRVSELFVLLARALLPCLGIPSSSSSSSSSSSFDRMRATCHPASAQASREADRGAARALLPHPRHPHQAHACPPDKGHQ